MINFIYNCRNLDDGSSWILDNFPTTLEQALVSIYNTHSGYYVHTFSILTYTFRILYMYIQYTNIHIQDTIYIHSVYYTDTFSILYTYIQYSY